MHLTGRPVTQTSESAVSQVSKPAGLGRRLCGRGRAELRRLGGRRYGRFENLRYEFRPVVPPRGARRRARISTRERRPRVGCAQMRRLDSNLRLCFHDGGRWPGIKEKATA